MCIYSLEARRYYYNSMDIYELSMNVFRHHELHDLDRSDVKPRRAASQNNLTKLSAETPFVVDVTSYFKTTNANLTLCPERSISPSDRHGSCSTVRCIRAQLIIEATTRSALITELLRSIHIHAEPIVTSVVDSVDSYCCANSSYAFGNNGSALDAIKSAGILYSHDEVGAIIAVKRLLNGNFVSRLLVDSESTAELVHARIIVVRVSPLST